MKKFLGFSKKMFAMTLVFIIALCSIETFAYASEIINQDLIYFEDHCENPLYHQSEAEFEAQVQGISGSYVSEVKYEDSTEANAKKVAASQIRDNMIARKGTFTVNISTKREDYTALVSEMFNLAISKDLATTPTAGDYLAWQYGGYSYTGSASISGDKYNYSFTFNIPYYTTYAQEQKVTTAVDKALADLKLSGMTTYDKIKKIYDYVCKVCNYDYSASKGYTKFTAYGALIDKKAVCQGYSVLLYRMLEEVGIDNKIITSTDHSWNIVNIDGRYYNVDATWDDNYYDKGYAYQYFLKCTLHFDNHIREAEYKTSAFNKKYDMTTECYYSADMAKAKTAGIGCSNAEPKAAAKTAAPKVTVAKAKAPTLTAIANGFTVKWSKMSGVSGYQIQYCTKSNFSGATAVAAGANDVSKKITGRGYGKKYYVRIRAYKKANGATTYGSWSDAKTITTPAKPSTVKLNSLKAASKGFTVKWKKISGVTGYQVQYGTKSNFSGAKTVTAGAKAVSKKVTKLTAKKKYYVRVRAYKKVNGTYVYGNWSTAKAVTTKK